MSQEFQRETRYAVFKFSKLNGPQSKILQDTMCKLPRTAECLVIESDWPEYQPVWAMIEARMTGAATVPPDGGEVEVLGYRMDKASGNFECFHRDEPVWHYLGNPDEYKVTELVDRAHITRLQAENAALQQRLNVADQRVDELEAALKFYADKDHYHFDEPDKWDSVSGEAENLLWHEEDPAYIEDGSVARNALKVRP